MRRLLTVPTLVAALVLTITTVLLGVLAMPTPAASQTPGRSQSQQPAQPVQIADRDNPDVRAVVEETGELNVTGTVSVDEPVEVEGSVSVDGTVSVDGPVEVEASAPLPVAVQDSGRDIVQARLSMAFTANSGLDPTPLAWNRPDGTGFTEIPAGSALFLTDILIACEPIVSACDDEFHVVFSQESDGTVGRLFDIGGSSSNLPYSHAHTTPQFLRFPDAGTTLGVARVSNDRLQLTVTGYLESIQQ